MNIELLQLPRNQYIPYLGIVLCLFLAAVTWGQFAGIDIWRHDYIGYLPNYASKLATEGRWINYLFFDTLKSLPPNLLICIKVVSIACFFYIVATNYTGSKSTGLVCSLALLQSPSIVAESLWPGVSSLCYVFLALIALFYKERFFHWWFIAASILSWGTFAYCYFFMPFLLLSDQSVRENKRKLFLRLLFWMVYFVLGYAVSQVATYAILGKFIVLAPWRNALYSTSFDNAAVNFHKIVDYMKSFLTVLLDHAPLFSFLASLFLLYKLKNRKGFLLNCVSLIIACSVFCFTALSGVNLSWRSLLPFWSGLVFLLVLKEQVNGNEKAIITALLSLYAFSFFPVNSNNIRWYKTTTAMYRETIARQLPVPPEGVSKIVVHGDTSSLFCDEKSFNQRMGLVPQYIGTLMTPSRIVPAFRKLGYFAPVHFPGKTEQTVRIEREHWYDLFAVASNGSGVVTVVFPEMAK